MQVKQYILNQWESMGFPKLLSGFYSGEKTTDKNFWLELILVGQKYWSPLKNWLLFTVFFFLPIRYFFFRVRYHLYMISVRRERGGVILHSDFFCIFGKQGSGGQIS